MSAIPVWADRFESGAGNSAIQGDRVIHGDSFTVPPLGSGAGTWTEVPWTATNFAVGQPAVHPVTIAKGSAIGSGNCIVVWFKYITSDGAPTSIKMTPSNTALTLSDVLGTVGSTDSFRIYYATNITNGDTGVSIDYGFNGAIYAAAVSEFHNSAGACTTLVGHGGFATPGTTSPVTSPAVTALSGDLDVGIAYNAQNGQINPSSPYVGEWALNNTYNTATAWGAYSASSNCVTDCSMVSAYTTSAGGSDTFAWTVGSQANLSGATAALLVFRH